MQIANIEITHPDKVMYPKAGYTKADIANYYNFIAPYMLPHIKNHALTLVQYPAGIAKPGFYHKHIAEFYPDYIQRITVPTHDGKIEMVGVNNKRALIYLAGQNAIEFHMSLAKARNLHTPDQIIFDLDPSDHDFAKVRQVALIMYELLSKYSMQSYPKTTGSRGIHIHIPIQPKHDFKIIKQKAKELAEYIANQYPDLATTEFRKNKRGNLVFIDYLRNEYSATAIAPYSLRGNEWAGIATPISWDELQNNQLLTGHSFNLSNIYSRIEKFTDPTNF